MFEFRNFRNPPYRLGESQVVLNAIYNLLGKEYIPRKKGVTARFVSDGISKLLVEYTHVYKITGAIGENSCLLQDLIDELTSRNILTLSQIKEECDRISGDYYHPLK